MPSPSGGNAYVGADLGVLNDIVGFRLRRIQNHLSRGFAERLNRRDSRPGLFSALALVEANPGLSQTMLAREIGFDKATVVAIIDALEAAGWAERRRSADDRRRHALFITGRGQTALSDLRSIALANEATIRKALSDRELAQLFGLLDKIYAACFAGPG